MKFLKINKCNYAYMKTNIFTLPFSINKNTIARISNIVFAYLTSAIIVIASLYTIKLSPELSSQTELMVFVLIVSMISGIELGIVKSVLASSNISEKYLSFDLNKLIKLSFLRVIPASFGISLLWFFLDNKSSIIEIYIFSLLLSFIAVASSEARVIFDHFGKHSKAVWAKQGGLSLGMSCFISGMLLGMSFQVSVMAYVVVRSAWIIFQFQNLQNFNLKERQIKFNSKETNQWVGFHGVSILAMASGNLDRIVVSYFLIANEVLDYFLIYEIFTKYWLIAYLVNPILFTYLAKSKDNFKKIKSVLFWLSIFALLSVFVFWMFIVFFPNGPLDILKIQIKVDYILMFLIAIVVNSITQSIITIIQAKGKSRKVFLINILITAFMVFIYILMASESGLKGVILAWLVRSIIELFAFLWLYFRLLRKIMV
jgi:O-antigen/teichoic acid export membrane protein